MKNILITGGAGFIGSNFIHSLLEKETEVNILNLDALTYAGNIENLKTLKHPERYEFIQGDICDESLLDGILRRKAIDTVVHFAAESHVDRSIHDPGRFIQTNVIGTYTLLDAVKRYWIEGGRSRDIRFHHISTDEVFGSLEADAPAFTETTPYSPNSPYAASKAASDHLVRAYFHTFGLPVTITNCSNNYGPYQFPEKMIPLMILNAVDGKPLPVYGDGMQIRDWLFVEDHCSAIQVVVSGGGPGETYNVGGGNQPTNLEIIRMICRILDEALPASRTRPHEDLIKFVADRPGHDRRYAMDVSKIGRELGWHPVESLESGLRKTVQWYLGHPDWVANIQNRPEYEEWMRLNYQKRENKG